MHCEKADEQSQVSFLTKYLCKFEAPITAPVSLSGVRRYSQKEHIRRDGYYSVLQQDEYSPEGHNLQRHEGVKWYAHRELSALMSYNSGMHSFRFPL